MDDLTKCLYQFVQTYRMGSLRGDKEYQKYTHSIRLQQERILDCLDQEQKKELLHLIDDITLQDSIANEYTFQAALALAKDLNILVRA